MRDVFAHGKRLGTKPTLERSSAQLGWIVAHPSSLTLVQEIAQARRPVLGAVRGHGFVLRRLRKVLKSMSGGNLDETHMGTFLLILLGCQGIVHPCRSTPMGRARVGGG